MKKEQRRSDELTCAPQHYHPTLSSNIIIQHHNVIQHLHPTLSSNVIIIQHYLLDSHPTISSNTIIQHYHPTWTNIIIRHYHPTLSSDTLIPVRYTHEVDPRTRSSIYSWHLTQADLFNRSLVHRLSPYTHKWSPLSVASSSPRSRQQPHHYVFALVLSFDV